MFSFTSLILVFKTWAKKHNVDANDCEQLDWLFQKHYWCNDMVENIQNFSHSWSQKTSTILFQTSTVKTSNLSCDGYGNTQTACQTKDQTSRVCPVNPILHHFEYPRFWLHVQQFSSTRRTRTHRSLRSVNPRFWLHVQPFASTWRIWTHRSLRNNTRFEFKNQEWNSRVQEKGRGQGNGEE